ncbi:MAG: hypothetical protein AB1521_13180 [Bacteroidota bacterium]
MKTSRRKVLKLLGLSAAGLTLTPLIGCEKAVDELVNPDVTEQNESDAINLVRQFCESNIKGNVSTNRIGLSKTSSNFEPAWDFMAVVNDYRILSSKTTGNIVKVYVEYDYVGVHKGNNFYFHKTKGNNRKITAKYVVENGILKNGRTPFTQTELYKNHLRLLLNSSQDNIVRCGNNEFKRNHFIRVEEKYKNILSMLS